MKITPVPVRQDNYAYILVDEATKVAAAVDPYDVDKVTAAADSLGVQLVCALTTHHHHDHSGGNKVFATTFPDAVIYAGSDQAPAATKFVKDGDEFTLGKNIRIKCLATPCHTQDSICYHVTDASDASHPGGVFTGDTLFIGGCGRFFEGNATEMHAALSKLGSLPDETIAYIGHEYTADNAKFGMHVEPENKDIARLADLAKNNKVTAGLTTIGDEKKWNVFMRLGDAAVRRATEASADTPDSAVMNALREQEEQFPRVSI
ncbi:Lactamase-B domain-containing protein [Mycena sanguinolenta]|uniref:hydroxyacylglutathione hydrolase n=1 Tax=Mycena sanguinolenta TaxID=230812 RepID=A0A8H7D5A9_9AGAR|nr:Lactamase-B domain-containing protein [Mycena sanguinolenta]